MSNFIRVLFVEDRVDIAEDLKVIYDNQQCKFDIAHTVDQALQMIDEAHSISNYYHLVITDYDMPVKNGDTILIYLSRNFPFVTKALYSAHYGKVNHLLYDHFITKDYVGHIGIGKLIEDSIDQILA